MWNRLDLDPILEQAKQKWQQGQAQEQVDQINNEKLPTLIKAKRDGTLDERDYYCRLEGWERAVSASTASRDRKLVAMVDALPRTRRQLIIARIVAMADRYFNDPKEKNAWANYWWEDHTLKWRR